MGGIDDRTAAAIGLFLAGLLLVVGVVILVGRVERAVALRRHGAAVCDLLPPGARVRALVRGLTPPPSTGFLAASIAGLGAGALVCGPLVFVPYFLLLRRGRDVRFVAIGHDADGPRTWVIATEGWSPRPTHLVASGVVEQDELVRRGPHWVVAVGGEEVGWIPRWPNGDLWPAPANT